MIIKTNISSVNTNRLNKYQQFEIQKNFRNLSTGERINQAGDDPAGFAISEKMQAQIEGVNQAEMNAHDGISFIQTTEGYITQTNSVLRRVRALAIQTANGILTAEDRLTSQVEFSQMIAEVDRLASYANFNGLNMLTGRFANEQAGGTATASMWFHVGANMDQRLRAYIGTMTAQGLGLRDIAGNFTISISAPDKSNQAIGILDEAMKKVNKQLADLGAYNNRLQYVAKSQSIASENLQAAKSRIKDVDMASEVSELIKNQIIHQSQTAMIAQANQKAQSVLQLLQ